MSITNKQLAGRIAVTSSLGMMLQMLQYLTIFDRFAVAWPEPFPAILSTLRILALDASGLGASCTLGKSAVASALVRLLLPALVILSMYVSGQLAGKVKKNLPFSKDAFINAAGLVWNVFFVSLCVTSTSFLMCYDHTSEPAVSSMQMYPQIRCDSADYYPFIGFGFVAVVCYIILPFLCITWVISSSWEEKFFQARKNSRY